MEEEIALSYDDVLLVPKYSELESRAKAVTEVSLCGSKFKLPVMPANMKSVIDIKTAKWLSQNRYFYVYHRYDKTNFEFVNNAIAEKWELISISTGVNEDSEIDLRLIANADENLYVDFITIDVAHGHHLKVKNRIKLIKELFPETKVIAGNVATPEAIRDLAAWGADAVKVGIGQGSICTTRFQTGFSVPMFTCVASCCCDFFIENSHDIIQQTTIPIIADGGVKYIGDIAKALAAGATMVMSGALFANCIDSPAEIINGKKQYFGSTSFEAKKENKHIEGRLLQIETGCTIEQRLIEIQQALQSSISYAGGIDLTCFRDVDHVVINK